MLSQTFLAIAGAICLLIGFEGAINSLDTSWYLPMSLGIVFITGFFLYPWVYMTEEDKKKKKKDDDDDMTPPPGERYA